MLSLFCQNNYASLAYNDHMFLQDILPRIRLETGESIPLTLQTCASINSEVADSGELHYTNEEAGLSVAIRFRLWDHCGYCAIRLAKSNPWYEYSVGCDTNNGLTLHMKPAKKSDNFLSITQSGKWWTKPLWPRNTVEIPPHTQSLLWQSDSGYSFLTAICGDRFKSEFAGTEEGLSLTIFDGTAGFTKADCLCFAFGIAAADFERWPHTAL